MTRDSIAGNRYLVLDYTAPWLVTSFDVRVTADRNVNVYAVPPEGLDEFHNGQRDFTLYSQSERKMRHAFHFKLGHRKPWHLIIENEDRGIARVNYSVLS
jgi:hypothetical protein